jgi:hypothetical protein
MTINLADNDPRVSYAVAAGATQSSFTVSFEFFEDADLNVYVDGVLKTLTTDYTVTGGSGSTGSVSISVTGASGGSTVVITRSIALERTTDFPSSGPFDITSLNEELDKFISIAGDLKDKSDRALQLTDFDTNVSLTLPDVNNRKGTVLAFDSVTGAVVAGPQTGNVNTIAAIATDIATLSDIEDGTVATDAISDLAAIASDVTTLAGITSNITTVAGNTTNIATVVANITDIQNAEEHAQEAKDYAVKVNGQVQENGANTGNYSSKSWATGGTGVTSTSGAGAAKEWAIGGGSTPNTSTVVDGTEYSAKTYAIGDINRGSAGSHSAKDWASYVSGSNTVDGTFHSARYYAEQAAVQFDNFDDRYLGAHSSAPTLDNDGNALINGALYYDSGNAKLNVYDTGTSSWTAIEAGATPGFAIAMSVAL